MKTQTRFSSFSTLVVCAGILLALGPRLAAQTGTLPVVTIHAPDREASEAGDPGRFVLRRDGPTNTALNVYCALEGTASNGVDYATIPNWILVPAGVREVPIPVLPIDDGLVEGPETVVLKLLPSPLMPPPNYLIGTPSNAVVTILDNDAPQPLPVVNIFAEDPVASEIPPVPPGMGMPQRFDDAVFLVTRSGSTDLPLEVFYRISGTASNGVDYEPLSGRVVIPAGESSARIYVMPIDDLLPEGTETVVIRIEAPACILIYPPPPGCYQVGPSNEAVAYILDNDPETNRPPYVRLVKPVNGQTFIAPTNILLLADTVDLDGYVWRVEFFANDQKLGEAERRFITPPPPGEHIRFEFVWTNPPVGRHVLRARGTDDQGATGWSEPVAIWVVTTNAPPPLPIVTITAPDPIASEGTNCWRWANWPTGGGSGGGCLTNTATFVIRRIGPTNDALTVHYCIGGTASNGVDYVTLPGFVTIPAGRRAVDFKLIPLDDDLPERLETVVLRLCVPPDTTNPVPPYVIGFPSRAAAVIVDNDQPRPITGVLPDGSFHVMKPAGVATCWRIEYSTNLLDWTPICTAVASDGALHFVDPDAEDSPARFYRAVPELNPTDLP